MARLGQTRPKSEPTLLLDPSRATPAVRRAAGRRPVCCHFLTSPDICATATVACLYVHVAGSVEEMVRRMGAGVAPGGTLLLVGHRPFDPDTGAATPAAGQVQVSVETAIAALDHHQWEVDVAEDRPRAAAGTGVDAVVRARRVS